MNHADLHHHTHLGGLALVLCAGGLDYSLSLSLYIVLLLVLAIDRYPSGFVGACLAYYLLLCKRKKWF
jgi:hypothetical protein